MCYRECNPQISFTCSHLVVVVVGVVVDVVVVVGVVVDVVVVVGVVVLKGKRKEPSDENIL